LWEIWREKKRGESGGTVSWASVSASDLKRGVLEDLNLLRGIGQGDYTVG
jgi:hypothetical protein